FAEALSAYQPKPVAPARTVFAIWAMPRTWAFAAAAVVVLAAAGYLLNDDLRLRNEAAQARAALVQREQELGKQLDQQRSADAQIAGELARTRESLARLE